MNLSITPGKNNVGAYINDINLKSLDQNQAKEIKNTLNEAEKIMHHLPIIIRPILESLKNEMLMRIKII